MEVSFSIDSLRRTSQRSSSGILAFILRMLKAHENLRIILNHRLRSLEALPEFVKAMYTMEEGDKLLAELVRQMADIGHTGILDAPDHVTGPSIIIDSLMKSAIKGQSKS